MNEKQINLCFEPMRQVSSTWYHCDNKFHTEVIADLLHDGNSYGFIILDGNGCLFGTVQGNSKNILHKFSVDLPRKHGQSALRFSRIRVEKRHNYLRKVVEKCEELFLVNGECNLSGIVLAGSADFKDQLNQSSIFNPALQQKVIKVVDVSHGGEIGFEQAINLSVDCLVSVKFVQEKQLIGKFFEQINREDEKYCFGIEETMKILQIGAIEKLICWENLNWQRLKIRDENNEESVIFVDDALKFPGHPTKILEQNSLLEWLAEHYMEYGTTLEIVSEKSQEGNQFVNGFGGFGGILRYNVEFEKFPAEEEVESLEM